MTRPASQGQGKKMASCVISKEEKIAEWPGLFLYDLKTKQDSLVFVKRMLAVAVSSITYLRGIFSENVYRSRYLEDLCIKVLREESNTPAANYLVKWMMGSFDAIQKQYLQVMCIGVYTDPEDRNLLIESYQFNFRYTETGPEMNIFSPRNKEMEIQVTLEETKRSTVVLIRKLFLLLQNLGALPDGVHLTMRLFYYDDITPPDYQPPGFQEGVSDQMWFQRSPVHFKVGKVATIYHSMRVRVTVEQSRVQKLQEPMQAASAREVIEKKDEDLPSEDESAAQFKKPRKQPAKKKRAPKSVVRKRCRRI